MLNCQFSNEWSINSADKRRRKLMSQVLRMQDQLMQGFLISENRLKKKQEELNQEVETQLSTAQTVLAEKKQNAKEKSKEKIERTKSESKLVIESLENYGSFVKDFQNRLKDLATVNSMQSPKTLLDKTHQKLISLQQDIQSKKLIDFNVICQSVSDVVDPALSIQKEFNTQSQRYIQEKAQMDEELTRQNEEFILSVLLMIVSAGLIIGMIWFVG